MSEEQDKDLGFGQAASRSSKRLINRDGSFNVTRRGLGFWKSAGMYHAMLSMGWWRFLLCTSLAYVVLNVVFALLYVAIDIPTSALAGAEAKDLWSEFLRCFFFSVQTSSTIGYGHILPANTAANLIVTVESYVGLLGVALITGLVFARFSRPHAHVLFSEQALIAPYGDGGQALMFRIVNGRRNQLIELAVQISFSWIENGRREFYMLELERSQVPFFSLNWTIVHPIDRSSPLHGVGQEELLQRQGELSILLTGIDETFSQTVHARSSYRAEEIVCGARFLPMFHDDPEHGIVLEIDKLSDHERVELP